MTLANVGAVLETPIQLPTPVQIDHALAAIVLEIRGLQHDLTDAESAWAVQIAQGRQP